MKHILKYLVVVLLFAGLSFSCGRRKTKLTADTVTLSYVVGLNVGHTLLEMDSTLNVDAVCTAIRDVYKGTASMTMAEARDYYLAEKTYFVHEKAQAYQEQYLEDLSRHDRQYVRTRSGVTYKILRLGDQSRQTSMGVRDTVKLVYTISNEQGEILVNADTVRDSYRGFVKGLQEVVRLAGEGAHFNAWLPSKQAYDVEGNDSLGVASNMMLNYDVEVLQIEYRR